MTEEANDIGYLIRIARSRIERIVERDLQSEAVVWARQAMGDLDAALGLCDRVDDNLSSAWAEAEAALPEGGYVWLEGPYHGPPPIATHGYTAHAYRTEVREGAIGRAEDFGKGTGPNPAAALRALAKRLRDEA